MADISITASAIIPQAGAVLKNVVCAEAVGAGDIIAEDANGLAIKGDADDTAKREVLGMAINTTHAAGQTVTYVKRGPVAMGAVLTRGLFYCLSDNAGKLRPSADQGTGDGTSMVGIATSTTVLDISIKNSGVALA